jgi:hypothetical protein
MLGGIAVDRPRELIEHDDEREPCARQVSPIVQLASTGTPKHRLILIDDGPVGAATKPPLELAAVGILVRVQPRREPEGENVLRCCHYGLSHSVRSCGLPGRAAHDRHFRRLTRRHRVGRAAGRLAL